MYLTAALNKKKAELERLIKRIGSLKEGPYDRIRISPNSRQTRVYLIPAGHTKKDEIYIKTKDRHKAGPLAVLDYNKKLLAKAKNQLNLVNEMLAEYDDRELVSLYTAMSDARKALIDPLVPDDDLYAEKWQAVTYQKSTVPFKSDVFITDRGEQVRSKSEKILADHYLKLGIPYRYECPVTLKDGRETVIYHPDFTVLNKRTRQIFYHEHLGKMDDPEYCLKQLNRMELYKKNDIYLGQQLFFTWETADKPLDLRAFDRLIDHYLR